MKLRALALGLAVLPMLSGCGGSGGNSSSAGPPSSSPIAPGTAGAPVQLSTDPFTDTVAQHPTAVEPSILANGNTIVSAFQVGRIAAGASIALGWATSIDGGATWSRGFLPGLTTSSGGTASSVTDAVVAYDAAHATWMVISLIFPSGNANLVVNRSSDGLTWSGPVTVASGDYDKCWVACDNGVTSPHRGTCYAEWDDEGNQQIYMSRTTDGGMTWSTPQHTADSATGIGGQIAVLPNGNVAVPYYNFDPSNPEIRTFSSTDGGVTWTSSTLIATPQTTSIPLRGETDPTVTVEPSGRIDVAWYDCRFESGCPANDVVMVSSMDGSNWSPVAKIGGGAAGTNHYLPVLAADPLTGHLVLMDYTSGAGCSGTSCAIAPEISGSSDAGGTWSVVTSLWPTFETSMLANTSEGPMVGDYLGIAFVASVAFPAFSAPVQPIQPALNQQIFTVPYPVR